MRGRERSGDARLLLIVKLIPNMKSIQIFGVTPFERPDVALALALEKADAFPVLHLGRDKTAAAAALKELSATCKRNFGICLSVPLWDELSLPDAVDLVILPFGLNVTLPVRKEVTATLPVRKGVARGDKGLPAGDGGRKVRLLYQVRSIAQPRVLKKASVNVLSVTCTHDTSW